MGSNTKMANLGCNYIVHVKLTKYNIEMQNTCIKKLEIQRTYILKCGASCHSETTSNGNDH